ncbi:tyrosine-type recombinase/integrase [Paenibacillus elgii]
MSKKEPSKKKKLPPGVRERKGRFTYRYSVEVIVDGKKKRKQKETPSYPTAKEAYDAGIQIEADRRNGKLVDEKTITLKAWGNRWLEDCVLEREVRPTTLRNRQVALKALGKHVGELTRLKDITGDDYQQFLNNLKKSGKKRGTIREYHVSMRIMFADAVRKNIIAVSPVVGAVLPVFKQTVEEIEMGEAEIPKFLEKEELRQLLQVVRFCGKPQEYEIFLTLAYTGLRIGELLALKISDFDEQSRVIKVTKTLTVTGKLEKFHLGPPKNKSSIRKVTIGDSVIKAIKSQLAWREKMKNEILIDHDDGFIFWSTYKPGFPASASYLSQRFDKLLKAAGLSDQLTPHSLRHTHVSLLAEAGEQLAVIQERLGHKNDQITKRVYLHVTKGQRKAVPDRFEVIMKTL